MKVKSLNFIGLIDYIKVTNRNNLWLDDYFNMEEQFTLNDKKSEKIVVLSDDYINLQPSSGKPYECYKVEI